MSSNRFKYEVHPAMKDGGAIDDRLMGMLRSAKGSTGPVQRWKKQYWVANPAAGRLEYYKNDQALKLKGCVLAKHIVSVNVTTDKQNKFYYLTLKLREKQPDRHFRMDSVNDRDSWYDAVMKMKSAVRSTDRIASLVKVIQSRTEAASSDLRVNVSMQVGDVAALPDELLPFCLEAVDLGIGLARSILSSQAPGTAQVGAVSLVVRQGDNITAASGTRYDPTQKKLTLVISIVPDDEGKVQFRHIDEKGALNLLSSSVWRDPSLEGWTLRDKDVTTECQRIAKLLDMDQFRVTLQWGSNVNTDQNIQAYLTRHVNGKTISEVYRVILEICQRGAEEKSMGIEGSEYTSAQCLRQQVTGISVVLDSDAISRDQLPALHLTHTMWQQREFLAGFAITSAFRQKSPLRQPSSTIDHLRHQLNEVVLHSRIAAACKEVEDKLTSVLGIRDGVALNWEKFVMTLQQINCDTFAEQDFPRIIKQLTDPYLRRAERLIAVLKASDIYESVFCNCISRFKLHFRAPTEVMPPPNVFRGSFYDTMVIAPPQQPMSDLIALSEGDPIEVNCRELKVKVVFPVAQPASWFKGFFANPVNIVPAPVEDELVDDEDTDDEYDPDEWGESVAVGRSEETRILSIRDVVNAVYDSQGSELELMASAEVINSGVDGFARAFPDVSVSKHDLVRILTHSLRRMRSLVVATGSTRLTQEEASGVLRTFCEYPESELLIDPALEALSHNEEYRSLGNRFYFQSLVRVALAELLPMDAVLAMRSRRDVLMLGLENSGKTLIQHSLKSLVRSTYPTIGVSETMITYREWAINVKELGGRQDFRKNWKQYLPQCGDIHAVIFVVDASSTSSFADAKKYLSSIMGFDGIRRKPALLLLNNYHATPDAAVVVERLKFDSVTQKNGQPHSVATCDVTMLTQKSTIDPGLAEGMDWLCEQLKSTSNAETIPAVPKDCLAAEPEVAPAAASAGTSVAT